LTASATHIFRLLRWGRTLARHGCLRIIEEGPNTPPQVRRLCRIARLGTIQPRIPDYAGAFQAIGPAAIKLGQTLATRPDIVGEEAARNLLSLQDSLPPLPFAAIRAEIEASFGQPLTALPELSGMLDTCDELQTGFVLWCVLQLPSRCSQRH
jgi:ubiquinone biosynthesis protein